MEGMVTDEAGLIVGHAVDLAAAEKETTHNGMRVALPDDLTAGATDLREGGLAREHDPHPARQQNAALVGPVRMQVDDRPCEPGRGPRIANGRDDLRKAAAVIEMPVGQEDVFDRGEIDPEPPGIIEPEVGIGADVEQHAVLGRSTAASDQDREPMASTAELIEDGLAVVSVMPAARRRPRGEVDDLRD